LFGKRGMPDQKKKTWYFLTKTGEALHKRKVYRPGKGRGGKFVFALPARKRRVGLTQAAFRRGRLWKSLKNNRERMKIRGVQQELGSFKRGEKKSRVGEATGEEN